MNGRNRSHARSYTARLERPMRRRQSHARYDRQRPAARHAHRLPLPWQAMHRYEVRSVGVVLFC
jgi:hypothetical protein